MSRSALLAEHSPEAVATAFLAGLFTRLEVIGALLDYWSLQFHTIDTHRTTITARERIEEGGDDLARFATALRIFTGALVDIEIIAQSNAVPMKMDKSARVFGVIGFAFATPHGVCTLHVDDEFLSNPRFWPPGVDLRPVLLAYATMTSNPGAYWEYIGDQGMFGNVMASRFRFAVDLGARLYRPSVFIITQCYRLFQPLFQNDETAQRLAPTLARRLVGLLTSKQLLWSAAIPQEEREWVENLSYHLRACQLPKDVRDLQQSLNDIMTLHVVTTIRELYQHARDTGREDLPLHGKAAHAEDFLSLFTTT